MTTSSDGTDPTLEAATDQNQVSEPTIPSTSQRLRVCIAGVSGATGTAVAAAVEAAADLHLVASVSRSLAGQRRPDGSPIYATVAEAIEAGGVDALIDFTHPAAAFRHVRTAVEAGVHVVLGTSGVSDTDLERLGALAVERGVGIITAGNLSPMVAAIMESARRLAAHSVGWEIVEYGDPAKKDAPGKTARDLARHLAEIKRPLDAGDPSQTIGDPAARGSRVAGTQLHSVRMPGFLASFDLVLSTEHERVSLRYEPVGGMEPFVSGTLVAVRSVRSVRGLRRGLESLLG